MRILVIAIGQNQTSLKNSFASLSGLGQFYYFDWTTYNSTIEREGAFENVVRKLQPHLVFAQIQTADVFSLGFIRDTCKLYNNDCLLVQWTGDVREPLPKHYVDHAVYDFDLSLFCSLDDVARMESAMKAHNDNVADVDKRDVGFLPISFNEPEFNPHGFTDKSHDIVFMGNNYIDRFPLSQFRCQMVAYLKNKFHDRFTVYGSNWEGAHAIHDWKVEGAVYRQTKIGINLNHYQHSAYTSDRLFRMMACGTFVLTYKIPDIDYLNIVDDHHLVSWSSLDELSDKIRFYLKHDSIRENIAMNGREWVWGKHRWSNRAEIIYKWYHQKHQTLRTTKQKQ